MPGASTPHVVLLALGFPPGGGSGTYRGLGTANHLVRLGWRVTVLTVTEDYLDHVTMSRDDSQVSMVDPAVRVVRVPMRQQHLVSDMRRWGALRGNFRQVHDDLWRLVSRFGFPERYAGWIPGLVAALGTVHRRERVNVVVASGNPWSTFAAAWAFRLLAGVPYVMDYRDAWTLDMFTDEPAYPTKHPASRWERRLVSSAARVVHVNSSILEWYQERYPVHADRMLVVHNGYDEEVVALPTPRAASRPLRFGFVGTITDLQPHAPMWEGWRRARRGPLADATFELYGRMGYFARSAGRMRAMVPVGSDGVRYHGPVPRREVWQVYESLDVLVLLVPGGRYITSGKIFESMRAGRPMVLVCDPRSDALRVSHDHPLVHPVEALDADSVERALLAAAEHAGRVSEAERAEGLDVAARYERGHQVARLDHALREVVTSG